MSKIKVEQLETLDGLNTKDVATLVDDINAAQVTTSTGTQGLSAAIDQRVFFKETKADLDAIPSADLTDGQIAIVQGTVYTWNATTEEWMAESGGGSEINVQSFGAVGDGVTDDGAAVREAIESLTEGQTLYFPPGHYFTEYADHTLLANWILITKNGVTIKASPSTVILENFLIAVNGSFASLVDIGAAGFTSGDDLITTAAAHDFSEGDLIQLLSQRNSYSTDGGDYQLGSRNPSTNILPERRFSEIHTVQDVIDTTSFTIEDTVIYPNYADNTTGLSDPMTGISSAQIRKISPVKGVTFRGLTFQNIGTASNRSLYISGGEDVSFIECGFVTKGTSGSHVRTMHSHRVRFKDCWSRRNPSGASGSGWNSFIIGGGTHNTLFIGCNFQGEQQNIDVTPLINSSDPFYLAEDLDGVTTQIVKIRDCHFEDCSDGATTHPGTFGCIFQGNSCLNVNTGFRGRSRNMSIQDNKIRSNSVGIALSAFYEDTTVSGNNCVQVIVDRFGGIPSAGWLGASIVPMSSEIMNNNDLENVWITGNSFYSISSQVGDMGVQIRHVGNGVPPDPNFTEFTNTIKTNLSNYVISNNRFFRCGVRVHQFINGVACIQNEFDECSSLGAYFESSTDSVRHKVGGNYFGGTQPTNGVVTAGPVLTYSYTTTTRVSGNQLQLGVANNSLVDSAAFNTD